jgi:DedD protein
VDQKSPSKAPLKNAPKVKSQSAAKTAVTPKPAAKPAAVKSKLGTDKPALDQQGVPVGWTLQLASFKDRANAVSLQRKLLKQGYKAYIRDKGELSKVFVGPDLQKSIVETLKRELKRKFKLDGLILRFRP